MQFVVLPDLSAVHMRLAISCLAVIETMTCSFLMPLEFVLPSFLQRLFPLLLLLCVILFWDVFHPRFILLVRTAKCGVYKVAMI